MVTVREHFVLIRQIRAARIDQINAGQVVLLGDFLRAQVLLDGQRVVGAAFDRGVVADDHAINAADAANADDQAGAGRVALVHAERGQWRDFEERRAGVEQHLHAVAWQQLAARRVPGAGHFAPASGGLGELHMQVIDQRAHGAGIGLEVGGTGVEFGFERGHVGVFFQAYQAVLSSSSPSWFFISSRILNFWILPVTVIGNPVTKRM